MAKLAWRGVTVEPIMQEGDDGLPGLLADIQVHGVWDRERASFFDTRVINADAFSYSSRQWPEIAESAAVEKHRNYDQAAENLHSSFSPLICSCEGVLHREFTALQRALISVLAEKWEKPKSQTVGWVPANPNLDIYIDHHQEQGRLLAGAEEHVHPLAKMRKKKTVTYLNNIIITATLFLTLHNPL
ncbi:Hypothetical protein NTJ_12549 [Nesidiocoris tenuis]|uniref:Uncharacterized protein n=1 Tax=Nesidiocoris tenuis TaxID=355587 RepID=A0ABN7B5P5_9HEMI|nr:Hypothetical protein NTJ_12549 [Nesidiocoris tenuis]